MNDHLKPSDGRSCGAFIGFIAHKAEGRWARGVVQHKVISDLPASAWAGAATRLPMGRQARADLSLAKSAKTPACASVRAQVLSGVSYGLTIAQYRPAGPLWMPWASRIGLHLKRGFARAQPCNRGAHLGQFIGGGQFVHDGLRSWVRSTLMTNGKHFAKVIG